MKPSTKFATYAAFNMFAVMLPWAHLTPLKAAFDAFLWGSVLWLALMAIISAIRGE